MWMLVVCGPRFEDKVSDGMFLVGTRSWLKCVCRKENTCCYNFYSYPSFMTKIENNTPFFFHAGVDVGNGAGAGADFFRVSASWGKQRLLVSHGDLETSFLSFFNPHLRPCLLISERGKRLGKRGRETFMQKRNINWLPLVRALNLCMCSDQESNPRPFGFRQDTQTA